MGLKLTEREYCLLEKALLNYLAAPNYKSKDIVREREEIIMLIKKMRGIK